MPKGRPKFIERLVRIETLLENHLKHHEKITMGLLIPILVAVSVMIIKVFFF